MTTHRVGLIVPSSNTTVETEVPRLLARAKDLDISFHSSRMRMQAVTPAGLRSMNAQRERCVMEVADAEVDAVLYACLVAVMASGRGAHRDAELTIAEQLATGGSEAAVLSSAGALISGIRELGARRVALVMPYLKPLAETVVDYLESEGIEVVDWRALEEPDNCAVGRIPGDQVMAAARTLNLVEADAVVLSCCVQMPSLDLIESAEAELGLPVLSAATAAVHALLRAIDAPVNVPGAGALLRADSPSLI